MERFCDENCNKCPIVGHKNSRQLTYVFNKLYEKFGDGFYGIIEEACPNMTCCYDCHIDDFCHVEGCKIYKRAKRKVPDIINQQINKV